MSLKQIWKYCIIDLGMVSYMREILPADTYIVFNKSIISDYDKKILNMLYLPIIGPTPIMLYNHFLSDLDKLELISLEYTHHHLLTNMHLSINEIAKRLGI